MNMIAELMQLLKSHIELKMFHKTHQKSIFLLLIGCCISLSPWIGFTNSPFFPMVGIWFQSEPLVIALFTLGGISAFTLGVGVLLYPFLTRWAIYHPVVYVPILISFLSLIHLFLNINYLSNFLGNVQTGQGIAWFLSLSMISAIARISFRVFNNRQLKLIVFYLILSVLIVSSLSIYEVWDWKIFFFDDHLAFFAIFIWPLPFLVFKKKYVAYILALVPSLIIVLSSKNFSAVISIYVMVVITPLFYFMRQRYTASLSLRKLGGVTCIFLPIGIALAVFLFNGIFILEALSRKFGSTIYSRNLLMHTIIDSFELNNRSYLFGAGWGQFSEALMKNIPFEKTSAFNYGNVAQINDSTWIWDSLLRFDFHSHNIFVDVLGSVGLVGLGLFLFYVYSLFRYSQPKIDGAAFGCVVGFILINSMWFQMPSTVGLMALSFGAMSGTAPLERFRRQFSPRVIFSFLFIIFAVLGFSTYSSYGLAYQGYQEVQKNLDPDKDVTDVCGEIITDSNKNGYHFSELFRSYVNLLSQELRENPDTVNSSTWDRLDTFFCQSDKRLHENNELISGVRGLMTRADFVFKFRDEVEKRPELYNRIVSGWSMSLGKVLELAPNRLDLVVPYFNWLLERGEDDELYQRSQKVILNNKAKAIGLWFSGVVMLNRAGQQDEGATLMRQAIENGLEKFMPVDQQLKKQLGMENK